MKTFKIPVLCWMVLLAGCQQAEEIENTSEKLPMSVEASIGNSNAVAGRYAGDTPNEATFTTSDAIGLLVNEGSFVKWTYNGSIWTQEGNTIYWNNKTDGHSFKAFYPHTDNATTTSVTMPDLSGQDGKMASIATRDFLAASIENQTYGTNGVVSFTGNNAFKHISALITLTLKGSADLATATINNISITGSNILTPSTYSFTNSYVTISTAENAEKSSLEASVNHLMNSTDATFYFIINANTVLLKDINITFDYTSNNKNYIATLDGIGSDSSAKFESGKQYTYTLNITDGVLSITGNDITDWENGGTMSDITINGVEQTNSAS